MAMRCFSVRRIFSADFLCKIPEYLDRRAYGKSDIPPEWELQVMCGEYLDNRSFIMSEFRDAGEKDCARNCRLHNNAQRARGILDDVWVARLQDFLQRALRSLCRVWTIAILAIYISGL